MKEVLESIFEVNYKEYKDYENFVKALAPLIKKDREDFQEFAKNNLEDESLLVEKMFDINAKPAYYQNDLILLQNRLVYSYETIKDVIEIPQEIKQEIENFVKPQLQYKVESGIAIEIDAEKTEKITKQAKENYLEIIKGFISKQKE